MEYVQTIKALTDKRGELAEEYVRLRTAVGDTVEKLRNIDSTLDIFGIERPPKQTPRQTYRGENALAVLTILREIKIPLMSEEVAK